MPTPLEKKSHTARLIAIFAVLAASLMMLVSAAAHRVPVPESPVPKAQDRLTMGEDEVKKLLALMQTDKRGMISKQEYMRFMEAEFERLDNKKTGLLNARQLTQTTLSANHFAGK